MDLHIHGRNMVITNQTKEHVNTKLGQIDRHLPGISRADVEVASEPTRSERDRIVVQVTLDVGGAKLRAQQRAANARTAVNLAAQALDRQIKRYKSQVYRSERDHPEAGGDLLGLEAGTRTQTATAESIPEAVVANGEVVRVKRFAMEPMTVDEAALRMERLDHSFFMFLDSETNQYGVLYRRGDDNYGLIQPSDD